MLESFLRDVEVGIRGFWKQPGFTLVSVLSVALGIGATTAVFGVARSLLDEDPTGVTRPDDVVVRVATYTEPQFWGMGLQQFRELQELQDVFTGIAAYNRRTEIVSTAVSGEGIVKLSCFVAFLPPSTASKSLIPGLGSRRIRPPKRTDSP